MGGALLDSSLIAQTDKKEYNLKLIDCNDYIQIYTYKNKKIKKDKNLCPFSEKKKNNLITEQFSKEPAEYNEIRPDNALRSKLSLERLIKTNCQHLKTFLTLTFSDNVSDINIANKIFNNWRTRVKKEYPSFMYVCVPEYQKRGAVHYHLLTNLPLNCEIIILQEGKTNQYDIKYWDYGFSSVFPINDVSIVSYMSKYMTKDMDNRLYGRKRYSYSKNLTVPKPEFLDGTDERVMNYINNLLSDMNLNFTNTYLDKISKEVIEFKEFKTIININEEHS